MVVPERMPQLVRAQQLSLVARLVVVPVETNRSARNLSAGISRPSAEADRVQQPLHALIAADDDLSRPQRVDERAGRGAFALDRRKRGERIACQQRQRIGEL